MVYAAYPTAAYTADASAAWNQQGAGAAAATTTATTAGNNSAESYQ
jgi:hypothetical protein